MSFHYVVGEHGMMPVSKSDGSAGFDLFSAHDVTIPPMSCRKKGRRTIVEAGSAKVPLDIKLEFPPTHCALIHSRSGIAKDGLIVVGGVIDSDFRGELCVLFRNLSSSAFTFERGSRIAQLVFHRIDTPTLTLCKSLSETKRGEGGFGSTGMQ